ncbi:MAG: Gfo/Idh/MocA family oxidoreductase [Firmicutes bacterium]|nr:Gfo/Idh/MocA family oxidoreductase [Bacillota bacterium]
MGEEFRLAIVGCGVIAKTHAEAIAKMKGARLVAVADISREKSESFAATQGATAYADYLEMLERPDLDGVVVCTPSGLHGEVANAAMQAGKHVITEKPMDISLSRCDEMIRISERTGKKLAVISQHRFDLASLFLHQAIEQGRLGRLVLGDAHVKWYRKQEYYDSAGWRGTWRLDGGGALINQSIHTIDLLQWMMGPVESIQACTATLTHRIEVEDAAVAALRFKNGALGVIEGTTSAYPGGKARLEVYGERGQVSISGDRLVNWQLADSSEQEVQALISDPERGSGGTQDPAAVWGNAHRAQLEDFVDAIRTGRRPLVDGHEGRKGLEIVLAVYEAARTGKEVRLPSR